MSCFLITSKGKGFGFFGLDIPADRVLSPHETHLIGSLANFLGGGIENANLIKTIRRHRQELRRLTEKLFQTQEEERRRIARELHDEAGQALTAVKLGLDRLEEALPAEDQILKRQVEEIRQMLLRTSSEIRRLSYRLHPTLLSDLGLEPALDLYLKGVTAHSKLKIRFSNGWIRPSTGSQHGNRSLSLYPRNVEQCHKTLPGRAFSTFDYQKLS